GFEEITIKAGTQPGTVITLKEKGIKHLQSSGRGHQHVHINVHVPTSLNANEKNILKDLAQSDHINPLRDFREDASDSTKKTAFFEKMKGAFSG
ncbi:MAG: DnaJ C-terminal domain-containing protein, partial [Ignavibacteria bacterium]